MLPFRSTLLSNAHPSTCPVASLAPRLPQRCTARHSFPFPTISHFSSLLDYSYHQTNMLNSKRKINLLTPYVFQPSVLLTCSPLLQKFLKLLSDTLPPISSSYFLLKYSNNSWPPKRLLSRSSVISTM